MNWLFNVLGSSIGKKLLMAVTGLGFCGFLAAHLAGNLVIFSGEEAFNLYAESLHRLGPIITFLELGLLLFALIHVSIGITLFYQNLTARPVRYCVNRSAGGRSLGSRTMPYTGILLLAFVIIHLIDFHFVDKTGTTIYNIVENAFNGPIYVAIYVFAVIVAAVHISHGLWSAFQTLGANHPKYMPLVRTMGIVFCLVVGVGFGLIPIYMMIYS